LENITDYVWDFGDGDTLSGLWPAYDTEHAFATGGVYPVTLTVSNVNSKCDQSVTKEVSVLDIPNIDFTADTVCFGEPTTFTNLTTLNTGTITGYEWLFPDGSTTTEKEPVKVMSMAGTVPVHLVVHNSLNCTDTLIKNVIVKALPEADFYTDSEFLEAFQPIRFFDNSAGEVATHFWDFGDGNTSTEKDPVHTYDSIAIYEVIHIVTNDLGCADTLVKHTNLNVYLELPTAFSPNGDGNNDGLGLIHRGIKELYDFKIYNRWGELVFDAGNQVDKTWDGTLNGKPQGYGVYVVHIKAKAAYDIDFNFKKNVTLLR
jgi:gliding motility-associated-like protein